MLIALLCAAVHGAALPIMVIVFGQMTDNFVQSGQKLNLTGILDTHWKCSSAIQKTQIVFFHSTFKIILYIVQVTLAIAECFGCKNALNYII